MKFLILKDRDGSKAYLNIDKIAMIQDYGTPDSKEDPVVAIGIAGGFDCIYLNNTNAEKVIDTIRTIELGVTMTPDYHFEVIKDPKADSAIDEILNYFS